MVAAPVGFQCPECVRQGNRSVRQPRTVFGAPLGGGSPYVTFTVIGLCVALFVAQQALGIRFTARLWLEAVDFQGGGVAAGEFYRLLTAAFLHADYGHLLLNLAALFLLGTGLEPQLGRARFIALYLLSALGGSAASYAFSLGPSLGASGAVFGLLGANLVVGRRLRREVAGLWVLLAVNVAYGFIAPNIDWRAHFGGLAAGAAVAAVFAYAPSRRRVLLHVLGCVVVLFLVIGAVGWRTVSLRSTPPSLDSVAGVLPSVDMCCGRTTHV